MFCYSVHSVCILAEAPARNPVGICLYRFMTIESHILKYFCTCQTCFRRSSLADKARWAFEGLSCKTSLNSRRPVFSWSSTKLLTRLNDSLVFSLTSAWPCWCSTGGRVKNIVLGPVPPLWEKQAVLFSQLTDGYGYFFPFLSWGMQIM